MEKFRQKDRQLFVMGWNENRVVLMHSGLWQQEISSFPVQSETDYLLSKEGLGRVRAWRRLKKSLEKLEVKFQKIE